MLPLVHAKDKIYWYISELTSRIVAETGIPSDRHHLEKVILQSLKDAPDFVLQIDAATGKSENFKSALDRSVRCALSLKKIGLKCGDVMAVIAPNYLELAILFYAALYLGIKIALMDPSYEHLEIKEILQVNRANIIFSENSKITVVKRAVEEIDLDTKIISFDNGSDVISFSKFIADCVEVDIYGFKPTDFDPIETIATFMPTSGTTGHPKLVAGTHKNYLAGIFTFCASPGKLPTPYESYCLVSPAIWTSTMLVHLYAPILRFTKIQTSAGNSAEHIVDIINIYRPQIIGITPAAMFSIINPELKKKADFTSFTTIGIAGSFAPEKLYNELKKVAPCTALMNTFGSTEITGALFTLPLGKTDFFGSPARSFDVRLVDPDSLKDISEPYTNGELWVRGPGVAKGYYNNPTETKTAFVDGWFRTGDIFYRDEQFSFYYVDRLKLILKCKGYSISPAELEKVIREHPGVLDVVVVGIPDLDCGDLPAACIVAHPDKPTAQEIKHFVKGKLSETKQLRGGVIFMKELPVTATSKVDRQKLKAIAIASERE